MHHTLAVLLVCLVTAGCQAAGDVCADARDHLQACFGPSASSALASSCDPARAEQVLGTDCSGLTQLMLDSKADALVEEQVREAIRRAIHEAIVKGVKEALESVLAALGARLSDYQLYLLMHSASSMDGAESKARELAQLVGGTPDFQPLVIRSGKRFVVVHGPCPLDLGADLPRLLADLAMGHPKLIKALGGELKIETTDDGAQIKMRLPLQLLPLPRGTADKLGCQR